MDESEPMGPFKMKESLRGLCASEMSTNEREPKSDRVVGSSCNNTMEATLCATSEVRAERVQWHAGVLTQPQSHSLGEKKTVFELTTTLYVLYASCTTCVIDPRFPEPKCRGPRGLRGPRCGSPEV